MPKKGTKIKKNRLSLSRNWGKKIHFKGKIGTKNGKKICRIFFKNQHQGKKIGKKPMAKMGAKNLIFKAEIGAIPKGISQI